MCEADLDAVLAIERALFSDAWTREMYAEEIAGHEAWVIEQDGEIAGMACGWRVLDEFQLTNIGIAPQCQREGLGRILLAFVIERQAASGCRLMFLEVRAGNVAAIALYEAFGFAPVGRRRGYYRHPIEDAVVMGKRVKPGETSNAIV